MARLIGPDVNSRLVFAPVGKLLQTTSGSVATVYTDAAGTEKADIAYYNVFDADTPGLSIPGSRVAVDGYSQLPLFWFPDGIDSLYVTVNGGPLVRIVADLDSRFDALSAGTAVNSAVVHNTGTETIGGAKTFTAPPVVPDGSFTPAKVSGLGTAATHAAGDFETAGSAATAQAAAAAYTDTEVAGRAADTAVVHNSGSETVAGVKTFTSSPVVPDGSFSVAKVAGLRSGATTGASILNATDPAFGATGNGATDDTAAIQAALNAAAAGSIKNVYLPAGTYNHTTLTLSGDNVGLILDSGAVLNHQTYNEHAISITGTGCSVRGPGTITSPATWNGANVSWTYTVISVAGSGCWIDGVRISNVPKVGIGVRNVDNVRISNCEIVGNYPTGQWTGVETAHFAIAVDPGGSAIDGSVTITGNILQTCVQGISLANVGTGVGRGMIITGNSFFNCWNHGVYTELVLGVVVSGNAFEKCQLPVAMQGDYASITGNTMVSTSGGASNDIVGISLRDPHNCVVMGNTLYGSGVTNGVAIGLQTSLFTSITGNTISDNTIKLSGGTSYAVRCGSGTEADVSNNIIDGNIVDCAGRSFVGLISVLAATGAGQYNKVTNNNVRVSNATYGIYLSNQDACLVADNTVTNEWSAGSATTIDQIGLVNVGHTLVERNLLVCRAAYGTNIALRGIEETTSSNNIVRGNNIVHDLTLLTSSTPVIRSSTTNGSIFVDNTPLATRYSGTGSPEGVVTAPVASTYSRRDGGAGTSMYVKESGAGNTGWTAFATGSIAPVNIQKFTAGSGTWTNPFPSLARAVLVTGITAGGGGGSGRRGVTGSLRTGGAGGASGIPFIQWLSSADLPATVAVTVGAGGTGGSATTSDSTDGTAGGAGGNTYFGPSAPTYQAGQSNGGFGGGGAGNGTGAAAAGGSNASSPGGAASSATGIAAAAAVPLTILNGLILGGATGGGAGGGLTTLNAASAGSTGGAVSGFYAGGTAGAAGTGSGGSNGGTGNTAPVIATGLMAMRGGSGGGGGGTEGTSGGGTGGNGGAGGYPGGGGGGGGASTNTFLSGAGGNGGDGYLVVVTF